MKLRTTMSLSLSFLLGLSLTGCFGSQQDEEELQAEEQQQEQASEDEDQEEEFADDEEELDDLVDTTDEVVAPVETVATPTTGGVEPNRVLRYVGETGAPAYNQAAEGQSLGVFPQGTKLMVVEEGEWSKIRDDMFVRTDSLSKKPVPRAKKKAVWSHPAH